MALPAEILEVALEKEEATRGKLLEMAMPVMQRERLERLDMFDMRMGTELIKQWSGDSAEPADFDPGREPRHGDAEQCLTEPTKQTEASTNACTESRASRGEAGLCSGETNASKKSGGGSGQDANDSETNNEGDDGGTGAGEQRGRNREEKGGTSKRFSIGCDDATGAPETAHEFSFDERCGHSCEDRRRCESCADTRDEIQGMREWRNASGNPTDAAGYAGDGSPRDDLPAPSYGVNGGLWKRRWWRKQRGQGYRCWEDPEKMLSDGEPEQRGQQYQGPEAGDTDEDCVILILFHLRRQSRSRMTKRPSRRNAME